MSGAKCFYPNGNPSLEVDIPCGDGDAVACCPEKWECQPNGLCFYGAENYYGRYTCTDKDWGPGCPEICTYDHKAAGNEAVLECTTGSYCCDKNRPELSGGMACCEASSDRFTLADIEISFGNTPPAAPSASENPPPPSIEDPSPSSTDPPVPSSTEDQTPTFASMPTTSSTGDSSSSCDSGSGEIRCGETCCTSSQFCVNGECSQVGGAAGSSVSQTPSERTLTATVTSSAEASPTTLTHTSVMSLSLLSNPSSSTQPSSTTDGSTSVESSRPSSEAQSSSDVTDSMGFKAGVGVGGAAFLVIAIILAAFFIRRRKRRGDSDIRPESEVNGSAFELPPARRFTMVDPPSPNPYNQAFPTAPSTVSGAGPASNRSRYNDSLVSDQEQDRRRRQPDLRHTPPLDPYAIPPVPPFANRHTASPAPTYHTEDQNPLPRRGYR